MKRFSRTILAFLVAWSIVFIPLAHSAVMDMSAMDANGSHVQAERAGASAHHHDHGDQSGANGHHHDDQAAAQSSCHHDGEKDQESPKSSEPCGMCQSHPICHTIVLPEQSFEFAAMPASTFEIPVFPAAAVRTYKPATQPPRL